INGIATHLNLLYAQNRACSLNHTQSVWHPKGCTMGVGVDDIRCSPRAAQGTSGALQSEGRFQTSKNRDFVGCHWNVWPGANVVMSRGRRPVWALPPLTALERFHARFHPRRVLPASLAASAARRSPLGRLSAFPWMLFAPIS